MKKALPLTLILIGAALLITAVVFWIDSSTSTEPQSFGKTLLDWVTLIAGLGASIKGWMDLVKKEPPSSPTQSNTDGGIIISGKVDAIGKDIIGRDQVITTNIVSEDTAYNVEGLPNPYLGLQAFTYNERDRYAGREKLTEEALQLLVSLGEQRNLLFVTGASGSGKSSFVQASLLPALIRYYQQYSQTVKFEIIRPSRDPNTRLKAALKRLGSRGIQVLIIDQFEELFTQSTPSERDTLLDFFQKLKPLSKTHRYVIATLRSDYLGDMFEVKWLWDIAKQGIELREMRKQELKDAILRPLQVNYPNGSKRFDPELVEKLAEHTVESVTYLPLLQVTLEQLWNKGQLKLGAYKSLTDAIKERADVVLTYQDFDKANPNIKRSDVERDEILSILLSLVNPSPDDDIKHDVRINRVLSEYNNKQVLLLRELSKARLVSIEVEPGVEIVNLIHETLIRNWDVLRDKVNEKRLQLQKRMRFETQLQLWISSNYAEDYLLSKGQVAEAQELEHLEDFILGRVEAQDFLRISTKKLAIEQKRGRMLSTFLDTFSAVSSTMDIESLGSLVVENAVSIIDADAGGFFLVDRRTDELVLSDVVGSLPTNLLGRRVLLSHVAENNIQKITSELTVPDDPGIFVFHNSIAVPLRIKDRTVVGFIEIINKHDGLSFAEDDQILLSTIAAQAAMVFENAQLLNEVQRSNDRRKSAEIFGKLAFTATASVHALRNHLGVIRGFLQLMDSFNKNYDEKSRNNFLNNQAPEMLTTMIKRTKDMSELLERLHEPWALQNDVFVDVNSCVRRAAERALGVDVSWVKLELASASAQIKTTPEMLTEAFKVIIKNANEAMESTEKEKLLEISSRVTNHLVEISIKDNGRGIEQGNLDKIFEMRYSSKQSGLGFGLFWTKDYVEGLGGSISVESELGTGTQFTVKLPVLQSTDKNDDSQSSIQEHVHEVQPQKSIKNLDTMSPAHARSLVQAIVPTINDGEADILAQQCHYLSLAIKIAVSVLHLRPDWTPSELIRQLSENSEKIEPVERALSLSYENLDQKTRKQFRQFYLTAKLASSKNVTKDNLVATLRWGSSNIKLFFYFLHAGLMKGFFLGLGAPFFLFVFSSDRNRIIKIIYYLGAILTIPLVIISLVFGIVIGLFGVVLKWKIFRFVWPPSAIEYEPNSESFLTSLLQANLIQKDSSSYKIDNSTFSFAKKQSERNFFDYCLELILETKSENGKDVIKPKFLVEPVES